MTSRGRTRAQRREAKLSLVALSPGRERSRLTVPIDSYSHHGEAGSVVMSVSGSRLRLRWKLANGKTSRTARISTREVVARIPTIVLLEELADRIGAAADITESGDIGVLADELLGRGSWLGELLAELPGRKHAATRRESDQQSTPRLAALRAATQAVRPECAPASAGGLARASESSPAGGGRDRPG